MGGASLWSGPPTWAFPAWVDVRELLEVGHITKVFDIWEHLGLGLKTAPLGPDTHSLSALKSGAHNGSRGCVKCQTWSIAPVGS